MKTTCQQRYFSGLKFQKKKKKGETKTLKKKSDLTFMCIYYQSLIDGPDIYCRLYDSVPARHGSDNQELHQAV